MWTKNLPPIKVHDVVEFKIKDGVVVGADVEVRSAYNIIPADGTLLADVVNCGDQIAINFQKHTTGLLRITFELVRPDQPVPEEPPSDFEGFGEPG